MRKLFSFPDLHIDREVAAITIVSTLLLMVDYYEKLTPMVVVDRLGLYLVIPLLVIIFGFRKSPAEYGFTLGDWKAGLAITAISLLI